ncbi:MAG: hypothetical protein U0075_22095 [Thermomicrobiales bacterium]
MTAIAAKVMDRALPPTVAMLRWPDAPPAGDAADWATQGGDPQTLRTLIESAAPFRVESEPASASPTHQPADDWPVLDPAALHGLAGEIVRALEPHTESDPVAILMETLVQAGNCIGRAPHTRVGATRHGSNENAVIVGGTGKSRKGSGHQEVRRILRSADATSGWQDRVVGGLSSGEGLIHAVRDEVTKPDKFGVETVVDPGVKDKRLLAVEPEFSSVLRVASREGSTLTEVVRRAWDGDDLRVMTRNSPLVATAPHVSLIGHITSAELVKELSETAQANGFANRMLFVAVRRSKLLPHGGSLTDAEVEALGKRLGEAIQAARKRSLVVRDVDANSLWEDIYPDLTEDVPGMLGALTARAEAHVLRLSLLYALLDQAPFIRRVHVEAALALWRYCEASVRMIFGDATGDYVADRIMAALRNSGPMTTSQLHAVFGRHVKSDRLDRALETLAVAGKVASHQEDTAGRPRITWSVKP